MSADRDNRLEIAPEVVGLRSLDELLLLVLLRISAAAVVVVVVVAAVVAAAAAKVLWCRGDTLFTVATV